MKLLSEIETFVQKELADIGADLKIGESALLRVATLSNTILNEVKAWVVTPGGNTLISLIEAIPEVGPIATEVVNTILPAAIAATGTVQTEATDPEALITTGVTAILGKSDGDVIASDFNTVQALVTNKIAPLLGVASTIQSALSVAQAVYASAKAIV